MNNIIKMYKLHKQKKCLIALKYVLSDESMYIYTTANRFLNYHKEFMYIKESNFINDPLTLLKHYYYKDLEYRRTYIKTATLQEYAEIEKIIDADVQIIEELTDDFINKYYHILSCIKYVTNNKKYLGLENKYLLDNYYNLLRNNNKIRIKSVN